MANQFTPYVQLDDNTVTQTLQTSVDAIDDKLGDTLTADTVIYLLDQLVSAGVTTDLSPVTDILGEVQATPTANTVLGRLKDIHTAILAIPASEFTSTNSTNIDLIKASVDNIETDVGNIDTNVTTIKNDTALIKADVATIDTNVGTINTTTSAIKVDTGNIDTSLNNVETDMADLLTRVGEVQVTPTANTVLARLKDIVDALSGTITVTTNFTTTNSINVDLMKVQLDNVKTDTSALVSTASSIDTNVADIETIVGNIKTDTGNIETDITSIDTKLTTTNSTLVNIEADTSNIDITLTAIEADTGSIDTKIGEVSATPTVNTVLGRLKDITDATDDVEAKLDLIIAGGEDRINQLIVDGKAFFSNIPVHFASGETVKNVLIRTPASGVIFMFHNHMDMNSYDKNMDFKLYESATGTPGSAVSELNINRASSSTANVSITTGASFSGGTLIDTVYLGRREKVKEHDPLFDLARNGSFKGIILKNSSDYIININRTGSATTNDINIWVSWIED